MSIVSFQLCGGSIVNSSFGKGALAMRFGIRQSSERKAAYALAIQWVLVICRFWTCGGGPIWTLHCSLRIFWGMRRPCAAFLGFSMSYKSIKMSLPVSLRNQKSCFFCPKRASEHPLDVHSAFREGSGGPNSHISEQRMEPLQIMEGLYRFRNKYSTLF